jgi:predicted Zn finger-like uncharacterized protein
VKISCQSCQAKYTIADEKVVGKIVKIRCKKCGATIVINGNESTDSATQAHPQPGAAGGGVYDYTAQAGGEPWTVNVSDGDQRSMTLVEVVGAFRSGTVNDETYCWKDGMADWLPLREIPELHGACNAGPQPTMNPDTAGFDQAPPPADDQPTQAGFSSLFGGAMGQQQQPQNGGASLFGGGAAQAAAPTATTAARRAGGRGGGGADLFGGVAQAGGEQDVMTSAAANPQPAPGGDGMTGARNENSVLFSLAALTSSAPEKKDPQPIGGTEGSGLIDIRALSASMEQKKDGSKKVDDIMNLSGGGAFSAALAAPVLAPAPADAHDFAVPGEAKKSNTTLLIGIIAGFVIVGVLVAGGVFLAMSKGSSSSVAATSSTTSASPGGSVASTDPGNTAAGAGNTNPTAADTGTAAAGTAGGTRPGVGTNSGTTNAVHNTGGNPPPGGNNAVVAPPPQTATHTGAGCAPGDLQCAMAAGAGNPAANNTPPPSAGGSSPFNPGNAMASLGPIANSLSSCKRGDGPTGPGHAKITFQPSGSVSSVEIDSGPYPGTAVGGCVAGKFRGAHVPPFAGGSVTVGKGFNI